MMLLLRRGLGRGCRALGIYGQGQEHARLGQADIKRHVAIIRLI
jgi:hypothetical protein